MIRRNDKFYTLLQKKVVAKFGLVMAGQLQTKQCSLELSDKAYQSWDSAKVALRLATSSDIFGYIEICSSYHFSLALKTHYKSWWFMHMAQ